jgi:hypothetical protein
MSAAHQFVGLVPGRDHAIPPKRQIRAGHLQPRLAERRSNPLDPSSRLDGDALGRLRLPDERDAFVAPRQQVFGG